MFQLKNILHAFSERIKQFFCWPTERLYPCIKLRIKYIQRRRRKICGFVLLNVKSYQRRRRKFLPIYTSRTQISIGNRQTHTAPQAKKIPFFASQTQNSIRKSTHLQSKVPKIFSILPPVGGRINEILPSDPSEWRGEKPSILPPRPL